MPKRAVWRKCYVCNATLVRGDDEGIQAWHHRVICRTDACREARQIQMRTTLNRDREAVYRELEPWPEGIRFESLDLKPSGVTRITRPETHRPYGTSASWAVGGGDL